MHTTKTLGAIASTMAGAAALAALLLAGGCAVDQPAGVTETSGTRFAASANAVTNAPKITGAVEIVWMGGKGAGAPDVENRAFAEFEGFEMPSGMAPRGSFVVRVYRVVSPDSLVLHREIEAAATGVVIDPLNHKAWMTAEVIADTKQCMSGGACDGHDGGEGGMGGPGGCTDCGGDTGHDGGCSGSDGETHDDGGCAGGMGGTDGGCGGSDGTTHDDGGCSGDDSSHDGGCAGGGSGGGGAHVSGSGSRVGQFLAIKMHDGDTPATDGDGITWKWFAAGSAPEIRSDIAGYPDGYPEDYKWPHLCKKTILGGNLMIHLPAMP